MDATSWSNKQSAQYAAAVSSQLGGAPVVWNRVGGVAIWDSPSVAGFLGSQLPCCLSRVMVKDEAIPHSCPVAHNDCVYIYVPVILIPATLDLVSRVSESVGYDKMRNMLSIRCGSLEMDIIILKIVLDLLTGKTKLTSLISSNTYVKSLAQAGNADFVTACYTSLYSALLTHYTLMDKANFSITQGYWNSSCGPEKSEGAGFFGWLFSSGASKSKRLAPDRTSTQSVVAKMQASLTPPGQTHSGQLKKEHLAATNDEYSDPWYVSNEPEIHRSGWDRDDLPYTVYSSPGPSYLSARSEGFPGAPASFKKEKMVEAAAELDPWYFGDRADADGFEWGAFNQRIYLPTHRDALLAQSEYTMSGLRELMTLKPTKSKEDFCGCRRRGCRCGPWGCTCGRRCSYCRHRYYREGFDIGEKSSISNASAFDDSYKVTDPRFLVGTAALHYNIDSDTQDITREYGTVAQKKHYPRLSDYYNYGIPGSIDPM